MNVDKRIVQIVQVVTPFRIGIFKLSVLKLKVIKGYLFLYKSTHCHIYSITLKSNKNKNSSCNSNWVCSLKLVNCCMLYWIRVVALCIACDGMNIETLERVVTTKNCVKKCWVNEYEEILMDHRRKKWNVVYIVNVC